MLTIKQTYFLTKYNILSIISETDKRASFIVSSDGRAGEIKADSISLTDQEQSIVAWIGERESGIVAELKRHVDINTGTGNTSGLDAYRELLDAGLTALGFATRSESSAPIQTLE